MWVEQTPSGKFKFCEEYTDYLTGKRKKVTVTLNKDTAANRRLALETLTKKIADSYNVNSYEDMTFGQLIDKYRAYQKKTVKPSTYQRNYTVGNSLLRMIGKDTLLVRLNAAYIKERLIASNKGNGTLNEYLTRLKAILTWGYENDYIEDIAFLKKLKRFNDISKKEKIQDKYLEPEELHALLTAIDNSGCEHWYYFTQILVLSGMRIGELIALKTTDVDLKAGFIHVTKTYDPNNEIISTPKTASSIRDIYIQPELHKVLQLTNLYTRKQKILCGYSNADRLYFPSKTGGYITYDVYAKFFRETTERVLGRRLTPHALRHTHASLLLAQGVSIDSISRRLGHENSKITKEIYLHVTQKLKEKDNEQIKHVQII